ncbi:hypothetical protein LXA43DRAFT_746157 [Ganoderma leucocontextum]|nr:hypothetical protein LXA43DRAFT_746157 [Ganoderma leucocontextum]
MVAALVSSSLRPATALTHDRGSCLRLVAPSSFFHWESAMSILPLAHPLSRLVSWDSFSMSKRSPSCSFRPLRVSTWLHGLSVAALPRLSRVRLSRPRVSLGPSSIAATTAPLPSCWCRSESSTSTSPSLQARRDPLTPSLLLFSRLRLLLQRLHCRCPVPPFLSPPRYICPPRRRALQRAPLPTTYILDTATNRAKTWPPPYLPLIVAPSRFRSCL